MSLNIIDTKLTWNGTRIKRTVTTDIIFHHLAAEEATVESVHNYHKSLGWKGIAYNLYVRKDGSVYLGRGIEYAGGGCEFAKGVNWNNVAVCICFEGNFETETMSDAQKKAGREVAAYVKSLYPNARFRRHKDINATACPGKNFPFDYITNISAISTPTPVAPKSTKDEVKQFQTWLNINYKSNLVADNVFGPKTKAAAKKALSAIGAPTVRKCSSNAKAIYILEGMLYCLGYDTKGFDGVFDDGCRAAVIGFQSVNKLTTDGICGPNTWNALFK